jgi:hypothetical protein
MDVTKRADKIEEGHKADVVFGELPDADSDEYLEEIDKIADRLARTIRENIDRRRYRAA